MPKTATAAPPSGNQSIPRDRPHKGLSATQRAQRNIAEFAQNIVFAQTLWRRYPELVGSEALPKPLLAAFRELENEDPDYTADIIGEKEAIAAGILPKPESRINYKKLSRPHKHLSATQEELADLASQMILDGGAQEDIELLLTALARHQYRNYSFNHLDGGLPDFARRCKERVPLVLARWNADLRQDWARKEVEHESASVSTAKYKTITDMVRADIRRSIRSEFEQFLSDREVEPIWALNEILEYVNAGEDLGTAIYYVMDRADIYIRVPDVYAKQVREYVELLEGREVEQ